MLLDGGCAFLPQKEVRFRGFALARITLLMCSGTMEFLVDSDLLLRAASSAKLSDCGWDEGGADGWGVGW